MTQPPDADQLKALRTAIHELRQIFLQYGETHWADQFAESVSTIRGVRKILNLHWPGMGGLSDLIISRTNGHDIDPDKESEVNKRMHVLMDIIRRTARRIIADDGDHSESA